MEYQADQASEHNDVVETLTSMFGNVISKEVISAVVESCDGDLNYAAEVVMNMSSDIPEVSTESIKTPVETQHNTTPEPDVNEDRSQNSPLVPQSVTPSASIQPTYSQPAMPPTISYAGASRSTGAVPKQTVATPKPRAPPSNAVLWTDQFRQLLFHHNQGSRILIIMRGVPGSGKSHLARQIVEMMVGTTYNNYKTHIFSTDDYFMVRGQYQYDRYKLSQAHEWNQNIVRQVLKQGLSPVIVDNTNVVIWEMEPYVREGVKNGYIIEVVEPNTPWAKKVGQLLKKNNHNVPATTIKRMLENYQDGVTGKYLIKQYGLSYPADMVPPVVRNIPEYLPTQSVLTPSPLTIAQSDTMEVSYGEPTPNVNNKALEKHSDCYLPQKDITENLTDCENIKIEIVSEEEEFARHERYLEIQKQMEENEKVELEWENGEGWEEKEHKTVSTDNQNLILLDPKPQRNSNSEGSSQSTTPREHIFDTAVQECVDWRDITMFMPSWIDPTKKNEPVDLPVREITYRSSYTCMEIGDTDLQNPRKVFKVMSATPRDINIFYIPKAEKIPERRMLDKGTITNELLITEAYRCKNEEQHFIAFRNLFKNVPRAALRDIFDKCCGDVNWAVDIVLNGMVDNQLEIIEGKNALDTEEETIKQEQCNCLDAYQIMPDTEQMPSSNTATPPLTARNLTAVEQNIPIATNEIIILPQKKVKIAPSESALHAKREIEKNIVISNDHYSEHTLKVRKWRHGETSDSNISSQPDENIEDTTPEPQPSTSKDMIVDENQQIKDEKSDASEDEESSASLDDTERTININLGPEFISQLDNLFGRQGMTYPQNIVPRINIPISLLNEINAFWMESFMCQLDEQDKQNTKMLKEDTDFARQLANKEAELALQGREPEVPDFKEIMDMDLAISLYQKDVAGWRSKEPHDMAAKLSREKLYNLFPEMSPDILSELLMAHDNNFQATVEVLLMSTGNAHILQEKNGLNKFVMKKEMERQEKLLEVEKKNLSEVDWPLLPQGEKIEMSVVNNYRDEADAHLARRNLNYQKAQDFIRRGMTQVANYYSDIAAFHKKKYEQANSLAAASLMQVHAANCTDNATIDLHYLRVGEAKESLDLFLDTHIQKLKETTNKGIRYHTLFFITGRGLHSNRGPRVKPAVKKRLKERGLIVTERNPGLLTTRVCADDKLSYQVQQP